MERQRHRCFSLLQHLTPGVTAPINCDGSVGRPAFVIPCSVLQHLLEIHLTVPKISKLLGVSVSTVRRRMAEYGLSVRDTYSDIGDEELIALSSLLTRCTLLGVCARRVDT